MNTVKEAVDFYFLKKKSGELSMTEIRKDLTANTNFSEAEINSICKNISDQELDGIGEKKMLKFDFLDNFSFSIFMILATVAIFIFSFNRFIYLCKMSELGAEINDIDFFLPAAFMLMSVIYLVRHIFKLIRKFGRKKLKE